MFVRHVPRTIKYKTKFGRFSVKVSLIRLESADAGLFALPVKFLYYLLNLFSSFPIPLEIVHKLCQFNLIL